MARRETLTGAIGPPARAMIEALHRRGTPGLASINARLPIRRTIMDRRQRRPVTYAAAVSPYSHASVSYQSTLDLAPMIALRSAA